MPIRCVGRGITGGKYNEEADSVRRSNDLQPKTYYSTSLEERYTTWCNVRTFYQFISHQDQAEVRTGDEGGVKLESNEIEGLQSILTQRGRQRYSVGRTTLASMT